MTALELLVIHFARARASPLVPSITDKQLCEQYHDHTGNSPRSEMVDGVQLTWVDNPQWLNTVIQQLPSAKIGTGTLLCELVEYFSATDFPSHTLDIERGKIIRNRTPPGLHVNAPMLPDGGTSHCYTDACQVLHTVCW